MRNLLDLFLCLPPQQTVIFAFSGRHFQSIREYDCQLSSAPFWILPTCCKNYIMYVCVKMTNNKERTFIVLYMTILQGERNIVNVVSGIFWKRESQSWKASKSEIRSKWKRFCRLLLMLESKIRYDLTIVMSIHHFEWILLSFGRWLKEQQFCHVL